MKCIMVMFDSLNRRFLPNYGCDWTHAPNFARLGRRAVAFDASYVCSMPCMPARRELHTGRPNFLHRSWGPLEPFDDSMPRLLKQAGVYTHLATDHYHYFEDGGATYHTQYNSWEFFRGQESDSFIGQVAEPKAPANINVTRRRAHWVNRQFMTCEEAQPQSQTFAAGIEFIRRNHGQDNWFLQIETFDPHEPFFAQRRYKDLYDPDDAAAPLFDWPAGPVTQTPAEVRRCRNSYAALLSMCDAKLGDVLDVMDELGLWKDTMLIVWTDHGFLLGEHGVWSKGIAPWYEELARTPFFVWDPRCGARDQRRGGLVQPSIDLPPTLLEFFGVAPAPDMLGQCLRRTIADDAPVRKAAIFGMYAGQVNVTDGRYVYQRATADEQVPRNQYTLMPMHMRAAFTPAELCEAAMAGPFNFTKGLKVMKLPVPPAKRRLDRDWLLPDVWRTMLFDLKADPAQEHPLDDPAVERRMIRHLRRLMRQCDAPSEQYERLGL